MIKKNNPYRSSKSLTKDQWKSLVLHNTTYSISIGYVAKHWPTLGMLWGALVHCV